MMPHINELAKRQDEFWKRMNRTTAIILILSGAVAIAIFLAVVLV
jgi:flagellar biosynthesis/type III secretory pathway M-ring protein FliF/YscJ